MRPRTVALLVVAGLSATSFCQNDVPLKTSLDFSTPKSVAQTLLGLDPAKLDSRSRVFDYGLNLLRGGTGSAISDGLSFAAALRTLDGAPFTFTRWKQSDPGSLFQNFSQISFAISPGDRKEAPGQMALGFSFPIRDDTNWMRNEKAQRAYVELVTGSIKQITQLDEFFDVPVWRDQVRVAQFVLELKDKLTRSESQLKGLVDLLKSESPEGTSGWAATQATVKAVERDWRLAAADARRASDQLSSPRIPQSDFLPKAEGPKGVYQRAFELSEKSKNSWRKIRDQLQTGTLKVKVLEDADEEFNRQAAGYFWNEQHIEVAVGRTWGAMENRYRDLKPTGSQAWLAATLPLGRKVPFSYEPNGDAYRVPTLTALTAYANLGLDSRKLKEGKFLPSTNTSAYGLRLKHGTNTSSFFAEGIIEYYTEGKTRKSGSSWAVGFERQFSKNQWINFSLGSDTSKSSTILFGLGFAYNLTSSRTFNFGG